MSILSQLIEKKITFNQAVSQAAQWFDNLLGNAPPIVKAGVGAALSDFKQAASNAVALGDTALGPIASALTLTVNTAANAALASALGPAAAALTPAVDHGIDALINAAHAELDAVAAEIRAKLAGPAPAPAAH